MIQGIWVLISIVIALSLSKLLKIFFFRNAKKAFFAGGGMPSSHCASVSSLASMIFFLEGFSTTFVLALFFAVIVFIDAIRVRRAVGINAAILGKILKPSQKKLVMIENGHTLKEAIYGCVLGFAVSTLLYVVFIV